MAVKFKIINFSFIQHECREASLKTHAVTIMATKSAYTVTARLHLGERDVVRLFGEGEQEGFVHVELGAGWRP